VNRDSKFTLSRRPYAVDPETFELRDDGGADIRAVWFRRKRQGYSGPMVTAACYGRLWDFQSPRPGSAEQFPLQADDGRYGGDCLARWDGANLWSHADEFDRARYLDILKPMLAAYPEIPPGFSGWWYYPKS
jgi:hypothetical protein